MCHNYVWQQPPRANPNSFPQCPPAAFLDGGGVLIHLSSWCLLFSYLTLYWTCTYSFPALWYNEVVDLENLLPYRPCSSMITSLSSSRPILGRQFIPFPSLSLLHFSFHSAPAPAPRLLPPAGYTFSPVCCLGGLESVTLYGHQRQAAFNVGWVWPWRSQGLSGINRESSALGRAGKTTEWAEWIGHICGFTKQEWPGGGIEASEVRATPWTLKTQTISYNVTRSKSTS